MKKGILLTGLALMAVSANAQCYKEGYVESNFDSRKFADAVEQWTVDKQITEDDNFFVSRVKPKARFRNAETQVKPELNESNDKRLIAWVPINNPLVNGLPDGKFDSEVFNMWSYVNHYGDWTATVGRIPGAFSDVAHKNGVGVSGVASIPFGGLGQDWNTALTAYANLDHQDAYNFLKYFGNDGIGYNSEFTGGTNFLARLRQLHVTLNQKAKADGNEAFENFWYDGTNDRGACTFDRGLAGHNSQTFGTAEKKASSLFFNYNWNSDYLLQSSVDKAKELGRSSLELYAGINMQGGEPRGTSWPLLAKYPISIGLWGAHTYNMFWESRNEKGSTDDAKLRTYMLRTERYFTGGSRNPVNTPEIKSLMAYHADNTEFHGMSSMMSARSTLKWDLGTEPFISYFNLGNGKFFNWNGVRQNDNEWYNIGVQDYLPTWRWWFTNTLLAKNAAAVPAQGLDAEFTWNDAYVGGSCLRIFGSTAEEYLHLFKTEYALQAGDVITLRYKLNKGMTGLNLVLTAKGAETQAINEDGFKLINATDAADEYTWVEKKYTVGDELAGKDLALVALHFQGAQDMDLYLGEFSIVRGETAAPAKPVIKSSKVLAYNKTGVDGKIIFDMPNDKAKGEPCYNIDVKTSMFKLYAQQEGKEPVLMGLTTSWAGLLYSCPIDFKQTSKKVRLGVAAVSLDMKKDSEIAWTEYAEPANYEFDDAIVSSKTTIKPNESFELSYVDPNHETATWEILSNTGASVYKGEGVSVTVEGLKEIGSYTLKLTGKSYNQEGNRAESVREFPAFIQITPDATGAIPEIYTLTANDQEADVKVNVNEEVKMAYTGRKADGALSRGLNLSEKGFGYKVMDAGLSHGQNAWTCSFWVKFNALEGGSIQFFDVRDQGTGWPQNNWGLFWATYEPATKAMQFTIRGLNGAEHTNRWTVNFVPGVWTHIAIAMEAVKGQGVREHFYVDGIEAERTTKDDSYSKPNSWWNDALVLIGQGRHQCAGMDAVIDDMKWYNVELKADQIKAAMKGNDGSEDVLFTFEKDANDKFAFENESTKKTVNGGLLTQEKGEGEGVGAFSFMAPVYDAGSPFVLGSNYAVTTQAEWKTKQGKIAAAEGNAEAGSATVSYAKNGIYDVTLTLSNSYGKDSKTFKAITVGDVTGIENAEVLETEVVVENGMALVNFASEGNYVVNVYNAAGQLVATQAQYMTAGEQAQIALGQAGVYVLSVQKDGKAVANVKLLNK